MDMNITLVGLLLLTAAFLAVGFYLDGHQRPSRAIPVILAGLSTHESPSPSLIWLARY
jgi:hypothetical protein